MSLPNYLDAFEIMIPGEQICERCKILGREISEVYGDEGFVAVGILRGCALFYSQLLQNTTSPHLMDFMFVSSYGNEEISSGTVKIEKDLTTDIFNRHVLLIDDIVDTGLTLYNLTKMLEVRKPKSVSICTMLDKKNSRKANARVRFSGFEIENAFVVGYGLDYKQYFRNLSFIGKVKPGGQLLLDQIIDSIERAK